MAQADDNRITHIVGRRFGRLAVVKEAPREFRGGRWRITYFCRCDCGTEKTVQRDVLLMKAGASSCGCRHRDAASKVGRRNRTHGEGHPDRRSREYKAWGSMKDRCYRPKNIRYAQYGGRGIAVCERWRDSFENFLADMGRKPSPRHQLDRYPNNDGDYEPGNVRWATLQEQRRNRPTPKKYRKRK